MIPVTNSSAVTHVDFQHGVLTATYKGGRTYRYHGVPADKGEEILASAGDEDVSTGQLVNAIKAAGYRCEKVDK